MSSNRPLSPHLSIYKPQITSMLSILHRMTGAFLYVGLVLFSWFLISSKFQDSGILLSYSESYKSIFTSSFGRVVVFLWSLAFFYHFCNGIRHLFWDAGYGFSLKAVNITGITVIIVSLFLTVFSWIYSLSNLIS
jgi:succinate dehydrogenase / fumarate reductase cytochrome b subunit